MATNMQTQRFQAGVSVGEVVAALERDGYAIVEGMLSPEEARAKRAELTRILESTPTGRNDFEGFATRRIYALFAKTRAFDEPAVHPLLLGVLDRVLGSYQLSAPVGIEIGPGETAQNLHRDDGIYPIPHPHPEFVVNTMWALTTSPRRTAPPTSSPAATAGRSGRDRRRRPCARRCPPAR
jgi:hypothetical protein